MAQGLAEHGAEFVDVLTEHLVHLLLHGASPSRRLDRGESVPAARRPHENNLAMLRLSRRHRPPANFGLGVAIRLSSSMAESRLGRGTGAGDMFSSP